MSDVLQTSKFEHDYLERTYSTIVSDVSVSFSELVANAWDAGATNVSITIPSEKGKNIIIEDNGSGMTDEEFRNRWMVMGYNRVTHQGEFVEYLTARGKERRLAYGRNGIGRHALFCFDDLYCIETWKDGTCNKYEIVIDGGESAFSIRSHNSYPKSGNGTQLTVKSIKKLPDQSDVKKTLGYRFLFDPEFEVVVNNKAIIYSDTITPVRDDTIETKHGKIGIKIFNIPEGEKSTAENGIAFWSGKRLVGNPSWNINCSRVEDARRKFAIRHIILIQCDFLIEDVEYDWSGYRRTQKVLDVYDAVIKYIRTYRNEYYKGKTDEVRDEVIKKNVDTIETLSLPARLELKNFFDLYLDMRPEVDQDELNIIIAALIQILNSRNGISLLSKLSVMGTGEIDALDKILDDWSIIDIKGILDEIDSRLKVIDAIDKLASSKSTDELHVLHPLISQARWLFGIEFDNNYFTFNRTLSTVIKSFLDTKRKDNPSINWGKRPDLVVGSDYSMAMTCTEDYDDNNICYINKVLIIELKKGGFTIKRDEMNQAEEYVDAIYKGNKLNSKPKIKAFVIGDSIDASISTFKTQEDYGEVRAYTYNQLVKTAEKRLFSLRQKLTERYNAFNGEDSLSQILNQPKQLDMQSVINQ